MKRQRENASSGPSEASASSGRSVKRAKSVQACASCRKHKTRCEILDIMDQQAIRCHRCKVLDQDCSYQEMDRSIFENLRPSTVAAAKEPESQSVRHEVQLEMIPGYSGTPTPANAPGSSNASLPTDIFPNKPHLLWDFIRAPHASLDWSIPLYTIGELVKQTLASSETHIYPPPPRIPNDSLDSILLPDQILYLTTIFERNYLPWLSFTPIRENHSPLLDLVYCTIASRHLDEATRSVAAPRLQALTADSVAKMIFQSQRSETIEAIQCLLILSLWAPVCGADDNFRDGRLLVASAISMAHNMRLNDVCRDASRLFQKQEQGEHVPGDEFSDAMNKTRLWILLTNAESLVCIGSGRTPLSKRTADYLTLFPLSSSLPGDLAAGRDLRLRLLAEMFDITEAGLSIRLESLSEANLISWYDGFVHVLMNLSRVTRVLLPLYVVTEYDSFYFQVLNIVTRTCRLVTLYQAHISARQYFVRSGTDNFLYFREIRPHGLAVLIQWGKEALTVSESVLVTVLELDTTLLATSPDNIFNMIALAGSYLIGCRFLAFKSAGQDIPGAGDALLTKCIEKLNKCSLSPDSAARKAALFLASIQALWDGRRGQGQGQGHGQGSTTAINNRNASFADNQGSPAGQLQQATPPASDSSSHHSSPYISQSQDPAAATFSDDLLQNQMFPAPMSGENTNWVDTGGFLDAAFWNDMFNPTGTSFSGDLLNMY